MNPNDQTPSPATPAEASASPESSFDKSRGYPKEDELFVIKPAEKKPLDKKSVFIVITLSVIGLILLVVVLVFALIGSASGLANDYRRLAALQLSKIDTPLKELEPGSVLNQRNLEKPAKAIDLSKQSLPSLESVLFVGGWSERYTQTQALEKNIQQHYKNAGAYNKDLEVLIAFDNAIGDILDQEPNLNATVKPTNSLTIRSAGGSYEEFAKSIEKQPAPKQISKAKQQLAEIYHNKSTIYLTWANLVDTGNSSGEAKAKTDLLIESAMAATLIEDESFIKLFDDSYAKLINEQKLLKTQLAS